jgi:hypothetical protein
MSLPENKQPRFKNGAVMNLFNGLPFFIPEQALYW